MLQVKHKVVRILVPPYRPEFDDCACDAMNRCEYGLTYFEFLLELLPVAWLDDMLETFEGKRI